ncbi:MAG: class I SAM-dependent methyltransferase [Thermodesulfobacteriota bacterium]|jgi:ubiquinone/menaquinone biosynthesis C-methylase UbiE
MTLTEGNRPNKKWSYGAVPLSRGETHDKVIEMMGKESRGKVLDVPTGTGILADRLKRMGFDVSCCDINPSYFSVPDLKMEIGDLNQSLPYPDQFFDYLVSVDGIEHTENPSNAIREFARVLRKGGKMFLTTANFLNIERRFRFLFRGSLSKIPRHVAARNRCEGDLSMAHISPLIYPLLKFIVEYYGFRILRVEKDRIKPRMKWLLPVVWIIRFYGFFVSKESREFYRLNETLSDEIIMGGNTLIIVGEKAL